MKPLLGSHRALGSVGQPTQPLPPQPEWLPPSIPTPSLLLTYMVLEEDGRRSPSGQDNGWGLGTSPPIPVTLPEGAVGRSGLMVRRPFISSGRETGCTTQPPIVGCLISGSSARPIRRRQLGPRAPDLTSAPLGGWRAWWGQDHAGLDLSPLTCPPTNQEKSGLCLKTRQRHGGECTAGPGSQLGFRRGSWRGVVKDELWQGEA